MVILGAFVALGGAGVVIILTLHEASHSTVAVGTLGVLGIVGGGVLLSLGLGGLLFGWLGGRPFFPVGSHRSVVATTTLAVVLGAILGIGYLRLTGSSGRDMGQVASVFATTIYGMFLVMFYVQGVRPGIVTRETLGLNRHLVFSGAAAGIATALLVMVFAGLNGLALRALGFEQPQMKDFGWLAGRPLADWGIGDFIAILAIVVLGPVVEELFFRGYVFNAYLRAWGARTAYIGSSLIFALIHGYPAILIAIFGMGALLAWSYRRNGTIVTPIVAHVLNNGFAIFTLLALSSQTGLGS
jgi:membrane protease YdiL (CAAX protease family)